MGKTATNISIALGFITVAFAGYYMYTSSSSATLNTVSSSRTSSDVLNTANDYIRYSAALDNINFDTTILTDKRFTTLRSFTTPIEDQSIGRENPFVDPNGS